MMEEKREIMIKIISTFVVERFRRVYRGIIIIIMLIIKN